MMTLRVLCFLSAFVCVAAHAQKCAGGMDATGNQCPESTTPSAASPASTTAAPDLQKQIDEIRGVLPKFAIPMREVGDRFQNMYYAAKGGNWALAEYMAKYMNGALSPAKITKPAEYKTWSSFYNGAWQSVGFAIYAKDFKAFDKAYMAVVGGCNACHQSMGYGFIEVVHLKAPADQGINYKKPSNPGDVPP
jgi:hypothetical protein